MGDVVLVELLKDRKLLPEIHGNIEIYALLEDESKRPATLSMIQMLREEGWNVEYPLAPIKPDKQFRRALELGAELTVRIEDDESVVLKNLNTKIEKKIPLHELAEHLFKTICENDLE